MLKFFHQLKILIFCEASKRFVEVTFGILALAVFVLNISLIFLARSGILMLPDFMEVSLISTIAAPISIILISEIYLLVRSYTKPLLYSLIFQIEVVSLIFIRDVFKIFASLEGLSNGNITENITEIVLTIAIGVVLFISAILMRKFSTKVDELPEAEDNKIAGYLRTTVSFLLLIGAIIALGLYASQNILPNPGLYLAQGTSFTSFFEAVFTMMILADVFLFLVNFIFNDEYPQLFRNVIYLISAILIRISLTADFPVNLILVFIGIAAAAIITFTNARLRKIGCY